MLVSAGWRTQVGSGRSRSSGLARLPTGALICESIDAAADAGRPPGAGAGEVVATVHLAGGEGARIRAGAVAFPARPGATLLRTDEMLVPPGEFLVVRLGNGY